MTPTEAELLRAAIETARGWQQTVLAVWPRSDDEQVAYEAFETALHALDAYRATPAVEGEAVEVKGAVLQNGDEYFVVNEGEETRYNGAVRARFTVPVPLPVIPTVAARVEG